MTLRQMSGAPREQVDDALRAIRSSALNMDLFPGIIIIYLKASLLAALTLFVSTFATSNIFTIVVMAFIYFIGHLEATAREYWLQEHSSGLLARVFLAVVALKVVSHGRKICRLKLFGIGFSCRKSFCAI